LIGLGFSRSKADYSLFIRANTNRFLVILVYVDDLLISGDKMADIQQIKDCLHMKLSNKDLGTARYFLGLEIARKGFVSVRESTALIS
jgi:hypothetical protein